MPEQKTSQEKAAWPVDEGTYTAINIGPREQKKRLITGYVVLALTLAALVVMIVLDISRWWRLLLFLPFWIAASGYFQAREKTCVRLAARGAYNLDYGEEKIEDPHLVNVLRGQANKVHLMSLVVALILTGLSLLIP